MSHATIEINGERHELSTMLETDANGTVTRHWFAPNPLPINPPAAEPGTGTKGKPWVIASVPYVGDGK